MLRSSESYVILVSLVLYESLLSNKESASFVNGRPVLSGSMMLSKQLKLGLLCLSGGTVKRK